MALGVTRQHQGKLDEAISLFQRMTRLAGQTYGPDHPAALESYRRAAAIFEAKLGKDHIYLSYALRGLGHSRRPAPRSPGSDIWQSHLETTGSRSR